MTKEDLIKYKEKLSKLSEAEKKSRDLYLRNIAKGEIQGPLVGYPSIDKVWLKHLEDQSMNAKFLYELRSESMYETFFKYASCNKEKIAFNYLGKNYSYGDFIDNIDKTANALKKMGISENEIVPILLPNMPEARYLIYACSKIGAIPNPVMPTVNEKDLEMIMTNSNCKHIFLMDGLEKKYENLFQKHNIDSNNIISISPLRSAKNMYKIFSIAKTGIKKDKFNKFLNSGKGTNATMVPRKANDVALIEQTGGTTGLTTKGVVITNGNIYSSNYQLSNGGFDFGEGDSILDILLPSISYGAAFEHLTICEGIKNYMIPILVKEQICDYISKYKPNNIMMGPIHFEHIVKDKKNRKWDFLKNIVSGGDTMALELEDNSNERLKRNKSSVPVMQGYGESECFGACVCNHNEFVKKGSVGIPHLLTTVSVFEYDEENDDYTTDFELPYNCEGEICISSPVVMKEYLNKKEETKKVLKRHSDGKIWLHTGDVGYIDQDGFVFITDRIKDLIFRNGFKVSPKRINNEIQENFSDYLDSSVIVGVPDENERNVPVLFYILKDQYKDYVEMFETKLREFYSQEFSDIEIPKTNIVIDKFPRTSAGKIDKKELRKKYLELNNKVYVKKR